MTDAYPVVQALSEVTGDTGQRIIRAMVAGERDPQHLADVCTTLQKG